MPVPAVILANVASEGACSLTLQTCDDGLFHAHRARQVRLGQAMVCPVTDYADRDLTSKGRPIPFFPELWIFSLAVHDLLPRSASR